MPVATKDVLRRSCSSAYGIFYAKTRQDLLMNSCCERLAVNALLMNVLLLNGLIRMFDQTDHIQNYVQRCLNDIDSSGYAIFYAKSRQDLNMNSNKIFPIY